MRQGGDPAVLVLVPRRPILPFPELAIKRGRRQEPRMHNRITALGLSVKVWTSLPCRRPPSVRDLEGKQQNPPSIHVIPEVEQARARPLSFGGFRRKARVRFGLHDERDEACRTHACRASYCTFCDIKSFVIHSDRCCGTYRKCASRLGSSRASLI